MINHEKIEENNFLEILNSSDHFFCISHLSEKYSTDNNIVNFDLTSIQLQIT